MTTEEKIRDLVQKYDELNRAFVFVLSADEDDLLDVARELEGQALYFRLEALNFLQFLEENGETK